MACPRCDHTMQNIGCNHSPYNEVPIFWCPRCGTLKANVVAEQDEVPMLVGRVVEFMSIFEEADLTSERARQLGIIESITLPGQQ